MLGRDEDLPFIGYWKLGLLDKKSEDELYNSLLKRGGFAEGDVKHIRGQFVGAEILRTFYRERDPLSLIVRVHILIESFLNEILKHYQLNENNLTFNKKLKLLKKEKLINERLYSDIAVLNNLRNSYSHNYYYNIADFEITKFSYAQNFYDGLKFRRKATKALLNLKTIQFHIVILLLEDILQEYSFLIDLRLKNVHNRVFYKETVGKKFGEILDKIDEETRGTKVKWSVKFELKDTSKKEENSK